jgi:hypothetical protein
MLMRGRADDGASVYSFLQPAEESREAGRVAHHARQRPLVEIDQAVARGPTVQATDCFLERHDRANLCRIARAAHHRARFRFRLGSSLGAGDRICD